MISKPRAWATLMTNESYLPGVIALAHSLSVHKTAYPRLVLVTPTLPIPCLEALNSEAVHNPLIQVEHVELLEPTGQETNNQVPRFKDTWTKLRVFELTAYDTLVFQNPDFIFDTHLLGPGSLAAIHDCTCTLRNSRIDCPYTGMSHPTALSTPSPVPPSTLSERNIRSTALNSGVFVFKPSSDLSRHPHRLPHLHHPRQLRCAGSRLSRGLLPRPVGGAPVVGQHAEAIEALAWGGVAG